MGGCTLAQMRSPSLLRPSPFPLNLSLPHSWPSKHGIIEVSAVDVGVCLRFFSQPIEGGELETRFVWSSSNTTSSIVATTTGLASGLEIGSSVITVFNLRLPENYETATLHVVEPGATDLRAIPSGLCGGYVWGHGVRCCWDTYWQQKDPAPSTNDRV